MKSKKKHFLLFYCLIFLFTSGIKAQDDSLFKLIKKINFPVYSFSVDNIGGLYVISYDNNIWLFDEQDNTLKKIDDNGNVLSQTVDFRLLFDPAPDPEKIIDRDGFVYLYDPQKGIYIFDYYGSFKSKLTFLHWTDIEVFRKNIYGFDKEQVYKYSPPLPGVITYELPPDLQNNTAIKISNRRIYVLKNQQLRIYSFQ